MLTKFKIFESTLISESSFYDISIDDILNNEFIKKFKKEDCMEYILSGYIEENDLNEENENEIKNSEGFEEYLKDTLIREFENFYNSIDDLINNDKLKIYRKMTVDENWIDHLKLQGKRLGEYWSWERESAESHWGDSSKKCEVCIESEINEKYVNWDYTIWMNTHPNYSEEKEIRLFKNTPIIIKSIEMDGEIIDISDIKNKIFYT